MSRGTGTGILVFGLILGAIGAILYYAVEKSTEGFDIQTAGLILLIVGIIAAVAGVLLLTLGGRTRTVSHESVNRTATGEERTEERENWGQ